MTPEKPLIDAVTAPPRAPKTSKKALTQFPKPRFSLVRDREGKQNCWKFFDYWKKLPAEMAEVCEVRIYRVWPVINIYVTDADAKNKVFEFIRGACPIKDPHTYAEYFLQRFNAGDWKLILQEDGVAGAIMTCVFSARSLENPAVEDLEHYPPQVDLRTLTRHTANDSYIRWLKRTNQPLPWEETEDDFMGTQPAAPMSASSAVGEAFRALAESHVAMSRQALEGAEKLIDARMEAADRRGPDPMMTAQNEAIKLVTSTSDKMIDMVTRHAGKQYDPMDMLERAAKVIRPESDARSGGGSSELMTLVLQSIEKSNDRVLGLYEKQTDTLREIALARNGDGSHGPGSAVVPAKSFLDQAEEYKRIADIFGWNRGSAARAASAEPVAAAPATPSWFNETTAPILVMGFQTILVLTANLVYNYAATKIKGMEPQQPGQAVADAQRMMQQQQGGDPAAANPAGDPRAEQAARERENWDRFIKDLEGPFLGHFFTEDPKGYTLAHYIQSDGTMKDFTTAGRANYMAICRLGKTPDEQKANPAATAAPQRAAAMFKQLCAGNHSLWSKIQGRPQQLDRFILEFMTYDKWAAEEADRQRRSGHTAAAAEPAAE